MKTLRHTADGADPARTRTFLRRLSLLLVALAFAAFAASALAGSSAITDSFVFNGTITNSDPVFSNPTVSTSRQQCGTPATQTPYTAGPLHYRVYTFKTLQGYWSSGIPEPGVTCVTVGLLVNSGNATAALYRGSFNPAMPGQFWLASIGGLGPGYGGDFAADWSGAGGATFQVVVFETYPNAGASYILLVEGTGIIMVGGGPTAADGLQSFRTSSAPNGVLVRWKTRSEHDALGFNLYRGETKKVRLMRSIVRASGDGHGHSYSYLDRSAHNGRGGPYYLEVVQRSGSKIMFGPALRKAAR